MVTIEPSSEDDPCINHYHIKQPAESLELLQFGGTAVKVGDHVTGHQQCTSGARAGAGQRILGFNGHSYLASSSHFNYYLCLFFNFNYPSAGFYHRPPMGKTAVLVQITFSDRMHIHQL